MQSSFNKQRATRSAHTRSNTCIIKLRSTVTTRGVQISLLTSLLNFKTQVRYVACTLVTWISSWSQRFHRLWLQWYNLIRILSRLFMKRILKRLILTACFLSVVIIVRHLGKHRVAFSDITPVHDKFELKKKTIVHTHALMKMLSPKYLNIATVKFCLRVQLIYVVKVSFSDLTNRLVVVISNSNNN